MSRSEGLDALDRRIMLATQGGLPLSVTPFHAVAAQLGVDVEVVKQRMTEMLARGVIRRIAAVPNHFALGYRANGMSVWNVDDEHVETLGQQVGALPFVSHCYRRPRHLPLWPYNLFAMVHGRSREEALEQAERIHALLGPHVAEHDILFSKRILKKSGMRLSE